MLRFPPVAALAALLCAALPLAACDGGKDSSAGGGGTSSDGGGGSGPSSGDVGTWSDAPGACPPGLPQVDLSTSAELASASRGEDAYSNDAPATCYLLHDGTYEGDGVLLYFTKG